MLFANPQTAGTPRPNESNLRFQHDVRIIFALLSREFLTAVKVFVYYSLREFTDLWR